MKIDTRRPKKLYVGAAQIFITGDWRKNVAKISEFIALAGKKKLDAICFPECSVSGYGPTHYKSVKEYDSRGFSEGLGQVCAQARKHRIWVIAGCAVKKRAGFYNTAYLINRDGQIAGTYAKVHDAGELAFHKLGKRFDVFDLEGITVGMQICIDFRFAEGFRELWRKGAQVVFHPTYAANSAGWKLPVLEGHIRARAFESNMHLVVSNAAGPVQMVRSAIADCHGRLLAQANRDWEELICAELNLTEKGYPRYRDERTDLVKITYSFPRGKQRSIRRRIQRQPIKKIIAAGAAQVRVSRDVIKNVKTIKKYIDQAVNRALDIVCFPEAAISGFCTTHYNSVDEYDPKLFQKGLKAVCDHVARRRIWVVVGCAEASGKGYYNVAYLINPKGKIVGKYAKTHPFGEGHLSGNHFDVFSIMNIPVGLLICRDKLYPIAARMLWKKGARIIFVPTCADRAESWKCPVLEGSLRARAAETGCFVVCANAAGPVQMVQSAVVNPDGILLSQAGQDVEELISAELDLSKPWSAMLEGERSDLIRYEEI